MKLRTALIAAAAVALALPAAAQQTKPAPAAKPAAKAAELSVKMTKVTDKGPGDAIGKIYFKDGPKGLIVTPRLKALPPGPHGFHVHEARSCAPKAGPDGKLVPALAAGSHFDPDKTGKHAGPEGKGHLGDLPALEIAADGTAKKPILAPQLRVTDLKGKALIIHAGGDNYADQPAALGGGGARIACGVI